MSTLPSPSKRFEARRLGVFRSARKTYHIDALYVTNRADIEYLTGCFEGGIGLLMLPRDKTVLWVGKMFEEVAPDQAVGCDVRVPGRDYYGELLAEMKGRGVRHVGFQGTVMTFDQREALGVALPKKKLVSVKDIVVDYRSIKDEQEIRLIRKCVRIAEDAFLDLTGRGAGYFIGNTEKAVAAELEYVMRCKGADRQGFGFTGIIVASGPNSASCHHIPTQRKIRKGDAVLFDWGAELNGYRSDITRVIYIESVPPRFQEIHPVVQAAQAAGIAAIKPGVYCHTVSQIAWDVVRKAGHGESIRHGLGHGIGLDIHERPNLVDKPRKGTTPRLKPGMVITVEPGIYYKGVGGVRIEDDVLVTAKGHLRLNRLPRDMEGLTIR
jgi:Xaa-Pro aminopeptidase